jgi:hypothetical protein
MPPDIRPDPVTREGRSIEPHAATAVAMTGERVILRLEPDVAGVQAVFELLNTSDAAESFEVGYPAASRSGEDPQQVRDFRAEVDGEAVGAAVRRQGAVGLWWICWPMEFAPRQSRRVSISCVVPTRDDLYVPPSRLQRRAFTYFLRTGAAWKDAIGHARIDLAFGEIGAAHVRQVAPEPTSRSPAAWTWEYREIKPAHDIAVEYDVYADSKDAILRLGPVAAGSSNPDVLLDFAENLLADGQHERAGNVYARLDGISPFEYRTLTTCIPPAYQAAWAYRRAGKRALAVEWARRAVERLEYIQRNPHVARGPSVRQYRAGKQDRAVEQCLRDCREWLEGT